MINKQNFQWNELNLGVCYYPEHWDKSLWEDDLKRMLEVGIHTIRIAEFAWSKFEPFEGEFTFEFFDGFMEVVKKLGMKVIIGTPTATPPAWLTNKYEEVLNCDVNGNPYRHGARRHYNYNSPKYIELSGRIVHKVASHYGQDTSIIGWQIDNELNCEIDVFYSESDTIAFREFLMNKYQTIGKLNEVWGTVFWNQTYNSWDEIYVPRKVISDSNNPHMMLDYTRFISESTINYCKMQSDIIRQYIGDDVFITTNGLFNHVDNHKMTNECLDVYTYDSYPNFAYGMIEDPKNNKRLNDRRWSKHLSEVRSVCSHFGIMEQQSGANGWNTRMEAPAPKPGQLMLWTMQSIAHGADFISYFRWRTCNIGTEIYWHGILDYDNRDNRKLAEVAKVNERIKKIQPIVGAKYEASLAVIKDYDNIWDEEIDQWHHRLGKVSDNEIFVASQLNHTPIDYIFIDDALELSDLIKYTCLIYPHPFMLTKGQVDLLQDYVNNGGTLIFGARTGMKDVNGRVVMDTMPGLARDLVGASVEDFTLVGPWDEKVMANYKGTELEMPVFNEVLKIIDKDTEILANYTSNYYAGLPAITRKAHGKGQVIYVGSAFNREIVEALLAFTGDIKPYRNMIELEDGCELVVRSKADEIYYIVMNYLHTTSKLTIYESMIDMDVNSELKGNIVLKAFETKVFKKL